MGNVAAEPLVDLTIARFNGSTNLFNNSTKIPGYGIQPQNLFPQPPPFMIIINIFSAFKA